MGRLLLPDIERLEAICAYIRDNPDKDLGINTLSRKFGVGASTLRRQFRERFKIPVYRYILYVRMRKARKLLDERSFTISQISAKVGYSNASNFTNAFIRYYGIPPSRSGTSLYRY